MGRWTNILKSRAIDVLEDYDEAMQEKFNGRI